MNSGVTISIQPPTSPLPLETAQLLNDPLEDWGWTELAGFSDESNNHTNPLKLALSLETNRIPVRWNTQSAAITRTSDVSWPSNLKAYNWPSQPQILALIPHRGCEPWLSRCLSSITQQSHPPTNIVVIDDASSKPPLEIVKTFSQVTLLRAAEQVGPYGLIQSTIEQTDYDAYLFQDADDWSSEDRLETLLTTAREYGAELVGSQEIRVFEPELQMQAVGYPIAVNQALSQAPGHPLLHPTSLVTRELVQRLGGFATGLGFGGDTEFLLRAHWMARIVNSPRYCYFRRKRPDSLTTAPATGLDSPARRSLTAKLKQRARANSLAAAQGNPLNLNPLVTKPPVQLQYLLGPPLRWQKQNSISGRKE